MVKFEFSKNPKTGVLEVWKDGKMLGVIDKMKIIEYIGGDINGKNNYNRDQKRHD